MRNEECPRQSWKRLEDKERGRLWSVVSGQKKLGKHCPGVFASYTTKVFSKVSESLQEAPGHTILLCFITFTLPQKSSLHLVVAVKNVLGFLLKNKTPIKG